MKNTTPILVLTGLAIVAAAGVAGLTRDKWMGAESPAPVATTETPTETAPAAQTEAAQKPAAPAAETAPAETAAAAPEQQPAQSEQPAAEQTATSEQTAAAQPEPQPATNAAPAAEVPTFDTVRVEKTGEAVIAGRAEAGAEVVVKLDGQEIGKSTANQDGAFVVVPEKPVPAGSGTFTLEAKGKDDAAPVASEQSVAVIVPAGKEAVVALLSPDAPTKVLQKPSAPAAEQAPASTGEPAAQAPAKLVSIDAVDYDSSGNIVFSGQGEKGNTARIYVDNAFIGDAPVGDDGRWTFSGTADVAQGKHTLRVDGLDAQGNVLNRVEVPFFREEQTKVAEATQPAAEQPAAEQPAAEQPAAEEPAAQTQGAAEVQPEAQAQETKQVEDAAAAAAQASPEQPAAEVAPAAEQPAADAAPAAEQPAAATATTTVAVQPREGRIVIQPGNNLWRISRVLYGSGNKFTMLYEANKDQIRNPDLIYPGQIFKTPDVAPKSETVDPKRREPLKPEENAATE